MLCMSYELEHCQPMLLNSPKSRLDHGLALLGSMVAGEHEALAALLEVLLTAMFKTFGQQMGCICVKGKAVCRIICRAACCRGLRKLWEMAAECSCKEQQ